MGVIHYSFTLEQQEWLHRFELGLVLYASSCLYGILFIHTTILGFLGICIP